MAEVKKMSRQNKPPTPRQQEIKRLRDKGRDKRTDQESARLDQLVKEERRERFLALAPKRTQRVLDDLRRLSNCGQRNSYTYSDDEAAKIIGAVMEAAQVTARAFEERKREADSFRL